MTTSSELLKAANFEPKSAIDLPFTEKKDYVCLNCRWLRDMGKSNNPNRFYECSFSYHKRMYYSTAKYVSCSHFNAAVNNHYKAKIASAVISCLVKAHKVCEWLDKPYKKVIYWLYKQR